MTVEENLCKLREEGWSIKEEFLVDLLQDQSMNYQSIVRLLMNTDLKECGSPSLPSDLGKGKSSHIKTPLILQVTNVRNVSSPKANEESVAAPRMLKITLTDGSSYIHGLELNFIKSLSLKTAPGTKLKLFSKINVEGGYLMLNTSNIQLIGGVVEELYEKWKFSQSVSKYSRTVVASDGSGPPLWVPFGQKITVERERNFKALDDTTVKKREDNDFEHQRKKAVFELSKESSQKVFGGGKQMLDSNVQKIINYGGFTVEEAEWALKKNKNDVHKAIQELKHVHIGGANGSHSKAFTATEDKGRLRGGRRGRGRGAKGKGNKGPDGSDDEMSHTVASRPSGPASLLDYLESRILDKTGENEALSQSEEKLEFRHSRGRYGRGRADTRQKVIPHNEPSLSAENWPTLGQEMDAESRDHHYQATSSSSDIQHETERSNVQGRPIVTQQNYSHSSYREPDRYNQTKHIQQDYRNSHSSYRNNNPSNYREKQSYRDQQINQQSFYRENQQHQQTYRNEPPKHDECDRDNPHRPRRSEQTFYRRGMGRIMQRGNGTMRGYSRSQDYPTKNVSSHYSQQADGVDYYYYGAEGNRNYSGGSGRVLTAKERELIAQFEKSMVMGGFYEAPSYSSQNRGECCQGGTPNYSNNYNYQEFSGTYEYYRGGEGYARRRRGGRRGRY